MERNTRIRSPSIKMPNQIPVQVPVPATTGQAVGLVSRPHRFRSVEPMAPLPRFAQRVIASPIYSGIRQSVGY